MKNTTRTRIAIPYICTLTNALLVLCVSAQTWETVDEYQEVAGLTAFARSVTSAFGAVWVAGSARDTTGVNHGVIARSDDQGETWQTADKLLIAGNVGTSYRAVVADSFRIFAGGTAQGRWIVRASSDQGVTWKTIGQLGTPSGLTSLWGMTTDGLGNVYAVGSEGVPVKNKLLTHWVVRKGTPYLDAQNQEAWDWRTLEDYQGGNENTATAIAVKGDTLYVVGFGTLAFNSGSWSHWQVRKSTDGGVNWSPSDTFAPYDGGPALAMGVAIDNADNVYVTGQSRRKVAKNQTISDWRVRMLPAGSDIWSDFDRVESAPGSTLNSLANTAGFDIHGNLYVVGQWGGPDSKMIWRVRKKTSSGWEDSDFYQYLAGNSSIANGFTQDELGNLYVAGNGNDASGTSHWIVRKLLTPLSQP